MHKATQTYSQTQTQEWKEGVGATFESWAKLEKLGPEAIKALKKAVRSPSNFKAAEEAQTALDKWFEANIAWRKAVEIVYKRLRQARKIN